MEAAAAPAGLAVYMRVSSDEQRLQGTIENQRAVLKRYLDAQGTAPYGWYEDEAVSGYVVAFPKRPDGARLLADIRAGHVGIMLVRKLDRFGRNAREILNAVHELEQAGARLISLKENVDTRTSAGRFFLTVLAGVAELERDVLMERIDEGTARRLESTTWMGGNPPIGYRVEGRKRDAHLVINDTIDEASGYSELDVVRLGWHLLVEQDWSVERICEQLDRPGIPTREAASGATSGRWSLGVIYRMLSSTIYAGERTYTTKDGATHTHPVPAILTAEQVAQMHAALERHRHRDEPRPDDSETAQAYLLRGLLRCAQCSQRYTTSWSYSKRVLGEDGQRPTFCYYTCQTRHQHRSYRRQVQPGVLNGTVPLDCDAPAFNAERYEQDIWADIEQFIRDPREVLALLAAKRSASTEQQEASRTQLADLQRTLDAL